MKRNATITLLLTILLVFVFSLAACKKDPVLDQGQKATSDSTQETGQEPTSSLVIPKPKEGLCVVHGRILSKETGLPPQNALFLAENVTAGKEDLPDYLSFSHMSSPRAEVDDNGFFYFEDIPEKQFAILLFEPGGNHGFVDNGKDDETMDYLWVNGVPNETIDMGTIYAP